MCPLKTKTIEGAGIKTNKTYTLKAMDDRNASSQKTTAITFLNGIYWGVAAKKTSFDSAFVLTLTKGLQGSKAKTFTVNAGQGSIFIMQFRPATGHLHLKWAGLMAALAKQGQSSSQMHPVIRNLMIFGFPIMQDWETQR